MQDRVSIDQKSWENIVNYYIQCYEKEVARNASFPWESVDKKYISLDLDKDILFTSDETILNVKNNPKLEKFLKRLFFRGRARKLYLSYPQLISGSGYKRTINPIFIHEVQFKVDTQNRVVSFELENPYPELNIGVLYQQGLITEEIILINNEITAIFREPIDNESPRSQFTRALDKVLVHLDISANIFDPLNLKAGIVEANKQNVVNDTLIYWGETSIFYQSMLSELQQLKSYSYKGDVAKTSLSYLIDNKTIKESKYSDSIFQIIPLDEFQEDAIKTSLEQKLTVITGPPGTGKSQVLVNLIVNALINDKSVLFASKNNKAVDVVYERLEHLVENSLVIRSGSRKVRLAALEDLKIKLRLINEIAIDNTFEDTLDDVNQTINQINGIYDAVEKLERLKPKLLQQQAEVIKLLHSERFSSCNTDVCKKQECRQKLEKLIREITRISERPTLRERVHDLFKRPVLVDKRLLIIDDLVNSCFTNMNSRIIGTDRKDKIEALELQFKYCDLLAQEKEISESISALPSINELLKELDNLKKEILEKSLTVYQQKWLSLVNKNSRNISIIQKYIQIQEELLSENLSYKEVYGVLKRKSEQIFQELISILPVWGVTNLSPKSSFPLKQNLFDIAVIDEASQCDIASALPLLYRAKKAVIIGDPNQLTHITSLAKHQDLELIDRNEIEEFYPELSYKLTSLYELAESRYHNNDIKPLNLRGHYRSHPDIIGFSNKYFYGSLELRNNSYAKTGGVRWLHHKGNPKKLGPGQILNIDEAIQTIHVLENIIQKLGADKSYGIITPFRSQVTELTNLMLKKSSMEDKDVIIDTVHKFQGDERDIVIFSPVIGEGLPESTNNFVDKEGNLLNVTVTRAREQFVVVGDLDFARQRNSFIGKLAKYIESVGEVANL